jgi:hypothetical protein
MADRLLYTKGMRAALRLLAEDPRVTGYNGAVPAAVLAEHRDGCEATIAELEAAALGEQQTQQGGSDA